MSFFPRLIVALRKPVVMAVKKPTPLTYIGAGWRTDGDALLANTAAAQRRQARRIGRKELAHDAWLAGAAA